jgi:xylan 1,4-beta-xylosidase
MSKMRYRNPVIPGFHPDPSVCRVGEDFYLVTSSFEYFPGVPVYHSRNLVNWTQIGHCLTRPSQLPLAGVGISGGIFAPTIRHRQGRFYMVTTNMVKGGGNFYVWSDDPRGEWSEPIAVDQRGIDPDLFWDDDGTAYFTCTNRWKIPMRKIDLATGALLSEPAFLWNGTGGHYPEAPHVYRIGGYYYVMIAEGGTDYGHCETMARAPSLYGPWESCPHNPILTHRSKNDLPIQATGHADLVEDPQGNWWMVCLGIRPKGFHACHFLGRETFLAPVRWVDGWPVVGNNGEIAIEMEGPDGLPPVAPQSLSTRDDFGVETLPVHWNFRCNPAEGSWSLSDSQLKLRCGEAGLNTMEGQSWVGRRQQHFNFRASSRIDFSPRNAHEEAGLTVFQNIHHHYEIALTERQGERTLIVRRTIGTLSAEVASMPVPGGPLTLVMEGNEADYSLGYAMDDAAPVMLARGETRYLSTEVGGRFTGVYLAMYATANGQPSGNAAAFDWFVYDVT